MAFSRLPNPFYSSKLGSAYLGDSLKLMSDIPDDTVDLIMTSPPFALVRKKEYGNVDADEYVEWFAEFAKQFKRIIKPTGSIVIDIGGSWLKGVPVRSLYHYEVLIRLCHPEEKGGVGLLLAQELYWYNPAKLPTPAEWVTVRRERVKDAVNTVWWLAKEPHPKANNRGVLKPYSESMKYLIENGYNPRLRPSGHDISDKFQVDRGGAIPPTIINDSEADFQIGDPVQLTFVREDDISAVNVIAASNTSSNDQYLKQCRDAGIKPHPARFPEALPAFAINLCTEPGDLVVDPFAGSNMTGKAAETLGRRWIAFEQDETYLQGSRFRFMSKPLVKPELPQDSRQVQLSLGEME